MRLRVTVVTLSFTLLTADPEDGCLPGSIKQCTGRELDKVSPFNVPEFLFSALFSRNSRLNSRLAIITSLVAVTPFLLALAGH